MTRSFPGSDLEVSRLFPTVATVVERRPQTLCFQLCMLSALESLLGRRGTVQRRATVACYLLHDSTRPDLLYFPRSPPQALPTIAAVECQLPRAPHLRWSPTGPFACPELHMAVVHNSPGRELQRESESGEEEGDLT